MQPAFSVILLLSKIVGVDIKGERCFGFAAVEWRSSSSEVWNWRVDLLSLPALTSRCERRALAGERFAPHGAVFFFSLLIKTQGPLIGSPHEQPTVDPKLLYIGTNAWVEQLEDTRWSWACRVVICLSPHFSHSLPFKGHHKWVFASEVLINKKCCLSCFSVEDLSHRDVCVIKSLNCICLPYLVKKRLWEKAHFH